MLLCPALDEGTEPELIDSGEEEERRPPVEELWLRRGVSLRPDESARCGLTFATRVLGESDDEDRMGARCDGGLFANGTPAGAEEEWGRVGCAGDLSGTLFGIMSIKRDCRSSQIWPMLYCPAPKATFKSHY